jgi:hypothetical protein
MLNQFLVAPFSGMMKIAAAHRLAGQQHDNLCGTYWAAIFLQSCGLHYISEQVAQLAGTVLPIADPLTCVPQGAVSRQDYHLLLPTTPQSEQAGTSVQGLMYAIDHLSQGAYCLIPVQAQWTAQQVWNILELCQHYSSWDVVPLCNVRTSHLWGTDLSIIEAITYLDGDEIAPRPADWDVGHFLVLAGIVSGKARDLILVGDTYPTMGWQGYHLQSADMIAQALNRDDGYQGGILLFAAAEHKAEIELALQSQQLIIESWDNGSPTPSSISDNSFSDDSLRSQESGRTREIMLPEQ